MVRSMMTQANLPISFQGDGEKPDLVNLHPWGCATYVHNNSHQYGKLGTRGKKCIFIRYFELSKGFVFVGEENDGRVIEFES